MADKPCAGELPNSSSRDRKFRLQKELLLLWLLAPEVSLTVAELIGR